jgi:hypothetical protein
MRVRLSSTLISEPFLCFTAAECVCDEALSQLSPVSQGGFTATIQKGHTCHDSLHKAGIDKIVHDNIKTESSSIIMYIKFPHLFRPSVSHISV